MTIDAYVYPTPNSYKVLITLELLGLNYKIHMVDIFGGDNQTPEYLKLNPYGLTPTIKDGDTRYGESTNIMQYLFSKYDKTGKYTLTKDSPDFWKTNEFLYSYASGISVNHDKVWAFEGFLPDEKRSAAFLKKLITRQYRVLEQKLTESGTGYFFGDHLTIADLLVYPNTRCTEAQKIDFAQFPKLNAWKAKLDDEPYVKAAWDKFPSTMFK